MGQTNRAYGSALLLAVLPAGPLARALCGETANLADTLSRNVEEYRNNGEPLIPTLLDISSRFGVPMGIEKVVPESLSKRIDIEVKRTTVRTLLDVCIRSAAGYAWEVGDGAVNVYGPEERNRPDNLFNLVIRKFELDDANVNDVNRLLREQVISASRPPLRVPPGQPVGMPGSYPGLLGGMERKRATIKMPANATLREILNRIISVYGGLVWIAQVPPSQLSRLPDSGLWVLLSPAVGTNVRWFLEPPLRPPYLAPPK